MTAQAARQKQSARKLSTSITRDPRLIEQAQRLRYQVFSAEYGCDLGATTPGLDADDFDPLCDHVVVTDGHSGQIVATTRILRQQCVSGVDEFYASGEFDLSALASLPGSLAELGRTCVHPDYRSGATIALVWSALAEYLTRHRIDYLIGCASIGMSDGGHRAWRIARHLQQAYLAGPEYRVTPRRELPHVANATTAERPVDIPPLLRAYMRLGARVCGAPCWDPEFRCADLLVLLEVDKLATRYSRHFLGKVS